MPLPIPPPIPKRVSKKPQSSKILLNNHGSPEKRAVIPSSSPRGVFSMRLALEDVTNAYPFQFVQSRRGDEFAKHASKKANKSMSLKMTKSSKINSDRYKSKPLALVSSTPALKNKDKLDILEKATVSKAPATEETCVLKETLTTERVTFVNDQEPSRIKRKVASRKRMSIFQKSSPSQRGTDRENNVNMDVATVDKKSKTKKAANTKRTSSPEEKTFIPGKYKFDLNDFLCNSDSSEDEFIFALKSRKKAKMENPTAKPLSSEKCTPGGNMSQVKSQVSQQVTYANKPLPKEPSSLKKRKPVPEKSPSQRSCALQEKHTNQKAQMYKYYIFQDSPSDEESVSQKALVLDKGVLKEEAPTSAKLLRKWRKSPRRVAIHCKPLESQPVCPATEKKTLSKMPLLSNQEQVTQEQLSPLKKQRQSHKAAFKEESVPKKLSSKQQFSNAREFLLKDPPTLKEKEKTTTDEPSYVQEPLTWKTKPTGDEIYFSPELFSSPVSPYKDESFSQEALLLPEKTGAKEDSFNKQLLLKGQNLTEEESLFNKFLGLKDPSTGTAMSTERQLSSEKSTTQGVALLMSNQMTERESITDGKESSAKQPLAFNHEKQLPLQEKLPPDEDNLSQGPLIFREMARIYETPRREPCASQSKSSTESERLHQQCLSFQELFGFDEECLSQGPVLLEDRARMRGVVVDEPLSVPKTPSLRKETPSEKQLYLQEKLLLEEDHIFQEPLIFPEAEATDEAAKSEPWTVSWLSSPKGAWYKQQHTLDEEWLPEGSALFEDGSTMRGIILNGPQTVPKTPGLDYETFSKQQASFREKRSPEEDSLSQVPLIFREMEKTNTATVKGPWAFQPKPSPEKATLKETLALQKEPAVNKLWLPKEASASNENPIARKLLFEDPVAVADESIYRDQFFLKTLFAMPTVNSSPVFGSTVFGGHKSTATRKSSVWESTPGTLVSSHEERTQIQLMKSLMEEANRYYNDPFLNSAYVNDIFNYLKEREEMFILTKYMSWQPEINSDMRAILVDWLVELQINFETSHETLYLAVKLVDHYLNETVCEKDKLQLLGCTAFMIAAKFEETSNFCVSDFLYICDDSYVRNEILAMETSILKTLKFDINIPTAYHFLRRYARCMKVSMRTLTLSRFVCEMSLQKYDYVQERASKLAAGAFLLALYMKNLRNLAPFLEFHSGYKISELYPLVKQLNGTLTLHFRDKLKTIYSKYSQKDFFEVSKIPPLEMCMLEKIFKG